MLPTLHKCNPLAQSSLTLAAIGIICGCPQAFHLKAHQRIHSCKGTPSSTRDGEKLRPSCEENSTCQRRMYREMPCLAEVMGHSCLAAHHQCRGLAGTRITCPRYPDPRCSLSLPAAAVGATSRCLQISTAGHALTGRTNGGAMSSTTSASAAPQTLHLELPIGLHRSRRHRRRHQHGHHRHTSRRAHL